MGRSVAVHFDGNPNGNADGNGVWERSKTVFNGTHATTLGPFSIAGDQVQGAKNLAAYFRPLPDGYWATPAGGGGIKAWPKIAQEDAAGVSGPKLAVRWGVKSSKTIYLTLQTYERDQVQH